jgi:lysophospholipase L1-like esterase
MRRITGILAVISLLVTMVPSMALAETHHPVYLSLGDSQAAGTIADESGRNVFYSDVGYSDQLYQRLKGRLAPDLELIELGCPGEDATTFVEGGICDDPANPRFNYDVPQLDGALEVLATRDVELITLNLGGNDILRSGVFSCPDAACVEEVLADIAADVAGILQILQEAAPDVPIVFVNLYNPLVAAWLGYYGGVPAGAGTADPAFAQTTAFLVGTFNALVEQELAALGVPVADAFGAWDGDDFTDADGDGVPTAVESACALSYMCPDEGVLSNVHANRKGYKVKAKAIFDLLKAGGVI